MKIPTAWIKNHLGRTISDDRLVEALAQAGIEIEGYDPAQAIDKRVVVGLVKKVAQHPNADKLRVAEVSTGEHKYTVVCGAPNLAEGQKVAFAQIGSVLPGGEQIREAKLRGEVSQGMICSAKELGLGDDHSGIIVLSEDTEAGQPVAELFPAVNVVDIKTPFNRFDVLSVIGLAREVAAFANVALKAGEPKLPSLNKGPKLKLATDEKAVPRFVVAELELGKLKELPELHLLEATGTRSISPVVDVTNFVMWEWGQPLHAYDADKVKGSLGVRFAKPGEKLTTLDGVERKLTKEDLIIIDDAGPVGLAGVMGGERTEVTSLTKRILLEAATFDAAAVRKTAKRHGLRSEASARFERGLPVQLAPLAAARAIELLTEVAAAKLTGVTDELRVWPWVQRIGLRRSKLNRLLGAELSFDEAINSLNKLGIQSERFDLTGEAKKHLGKPYVWGANFKQNGTEGFDCSYLVDYIYSLIGQKVGHSAAQQYGLGSAAALTDLQPGDVLFRGGPWKKLKSEDRGGVSHDAIYLGNGKVVEAADYVRMDSDWQQLPDSDRQVKISPLDSITEDPQYLGARRFVDDINDWISVPAVPWWRPDLKLEEDLIEEIVRVIGYDRVPATLPAWRPRSLQFDQRTPKLWRLKEVLSSLGLFEVMTYSFVSEGQVAELGLEPKSHLKVHNPMSQEQAYLRRSPLPNLLAVAARNDRYAKAFGMYEITRVFEPQSQHSELPREPYRLSVLVKQAQPYSRVKGLLDGLAQVLGLTLEVETSAKDLNFLPGRGAVVRLGKRKIGLIGQLNPQLVERHKIHGEAAYLELDADAILGAAPEVIYQHVSKFPSVLRDLNLRLPVSKTWAEVRNVIRSTELAEPEFVNDFYGVGEGQKNLAVRLVMTDPGKTLTDQEAEQRVREIVAELKKRLGAELAE
jgi:phenylalanyl-tRNA synthetase beta subunit